MKFKKTQEVRANIFTKIKETKTLLRDKKILRKNNLILFFTSRP